MMSLVNCVWKRWMHPNIQVYMKNISYTYLTVMFYCILFVRRALMNSDPLRVWSFKQCFFLCFCFTNEDFRTTSCFYYVRLVYRSKVGRHIGELLPVSHWKMSQCVDCTWMLKTVFSNLVIRKYFWERVLLLRICNSTGLSQVRMTQLCDMNVIHLLNWLFLNTSKKILDFLHFFFY